MQPVAVDDPGTMLGTKQYHSAPVTSITVQPKIFKSVESIGWHGDPTCELYHQSLDVSLSVAWCA